MISYDGTTDNGGSLTTDNNEVYQKTDASDDSYSYLYPTGDLSITGHFIILGHFS